MLPLGIWAFLELRTASPTLETRWPLPFPEAPRTCHTQAAELPLATAIMVRRRAAEIIQGPIGETLFWIHVEFSRSSSRSCLSGVLTTRRGLSQPVRPPARSRTTRTRGYAGPSLPSPLSTANERDLTKRIRFPARVPSLCSESIWGLDLLWATFGALPWTASLVSVAKTYISTSHRCATNVGSVPVSRFS